MQQTFAVTYKEARSQRRPLWKCLRAYHGLKSKVERAGRLMPQEQAMALAATADAVPIAERGPLHGLPMAPKDAVAVKGFSTSWGYPGFSGRRNKG